MVSKYSIHQLKDRKNHTIVAMNGAIILPILAQVLPAPTPTFLTTVGKTSLL